MKLKMNRRNIILISIGAAASLAALAIPIVRRMRNNRNS